jgi:hypothetical protein
MDATAMFYPGQLRFVQNMTTATGNNNHGTGAGFVYTPASGLASVNLLPTVASKLTYPCLDMGAYNAADPTYEVDRRETQNGYNVTIHADDSPYPGTGQLPPVTNNTLLQSIDFKYDFKVYAVVRFWRGDGSAKDGSIYAIGNTHWSADCFADTYKAGFGVSVIETPNGVTADAGFSRTNDNPLITNGPIWNGSVEYR